MIRLCKNCRFAALEERDGKMMWICMHPTSLFHPGPDYVMGRPVTPRQLKCYDARYFDADDRCGPRGRYWEAR